MFSVYPPRFSSTPTPLGVRNLSAKRKNITLTKSAYRQNSLQRPPQFKLKRLLHILSNACLVINLIVFAILLPDIRIWTLGLAFCFLAYTFLQLFDKRKDQWAWWVIIFGIVISALVSVCFVLLFELYLYFAVIAAEIIISAVIPYIFKKK